MRPFLIPGVCSLQCCPIWMVTFILRNENEGRALGSKWTSSGQWQAVPPLAIDAGELGPIMVRLRERSPRLSPALEQLYAEAMANFDAICFWHDRPPPTLQGVRQTAMLLEKYGSTQARRLARDIRQSVDELLD